MSQCKPMTEARNPGHQSMPVPLSTGRGVVCCKKFQIIHNLTCKCRMSLLDHGTTIRPTSPTSGLLLKTTYTSSKNARRGVMSSVHRPKTQSPQPSPNKRLQAEFANGHVQFAQLLEVAVRRPPVHATRRRRGNPSCQ